MMFYPTRFLYADIEVTFWDDGFPGYHLHIHDTRHATGCDEKQYRLSLHGRLTQPDITPESFYTTRESAHITLGGTGDAILNALEVAVVAGRFTPSLDGDVYFELTEVRLREVDEQSPLLGSVIGQVIHWGLDHEDVTDEVTRLTRESSLERCWDNADTADRLRQQARACVVANSFVETPLHRLALARNRETKQIP